MENKNKNIRNPSNGIKEELNALLNLNKKRKSALDKMSKLLKKKRSKNFEI